MAGVVQEDYSLKLLGFPLLKKFRGIPEFSTWDFLERILIFNGYYFQIIFSEPILIQPIFTKNPAGRARLETYKKLCEDHPELNSKLQELISYQLMNSGVLDELSEIPRSYTSRGKEIGQKIVIVIGAGLQSKVTATRFHNDGTLFTILKYFKMDSEYVLGTEMLFTDQKKSENHHYLINGTSTYSTEKYGKVAFIRNELNEFYTTSRKNAILRGLYNVGDTLVWADMLVKHAISTPAENIRGRTLDITLANVLGEVSDEVEITSERILTSPEHLIGRGYFALVVYALSDNEWPGYLPNDESLIFPCEAPIVDVNEINFDMDTYLDFLNNIRESYFHSGPIKIKAVGKRKPTRKRKGKRKRVSKNRKKLRY